MTAERLRVVRDGAVLATLERSTPEDIRLTYEPSIVERAAGEPVISTSLVVRKEAYRTAELLPFFEGLLPEETARLRLARRLRLDATDVFGFLREVGRECAGALSVIPEGMDLTTENDASGVLWLDEDALVQRIRELGERPLAVEPGQNIRISLAGAQDKMVVVVDRGRIGLPTGLTPSTHILKPASLEMTRGRRTYPDLVANEAFCSVLAMNAGLAVPAVSVQVIDGEPALLIRRYDRYESSGQVRRLHQEDFCQALGVRTLQKYEADGGPGVGAYLGLLRTWSADVATDVDELIDRIGLNYLVGNADAHAKNFSLLYRLDGLRLAPAYDIVSTYVYPSLSRDFATAIDGRYDAGALHPNHWRRWFEALDLSPARYATRLSELADRVEAALKPAHRWTRDQGIRSRIPDRIGQLVKQRARALRALTAGAVARPG